MTEGRGDSLQSLPCRSVLVIDIPEDGGRHGQFNDTISIRRRAPQHRRCFLKCQSVTTDQFHNLLILNFQKFGPPPLDANYFKELALQSKGFVCNLSLALQNTTVEIPTAEGPNVMLYTVPDCLKKCSFACEPHEVGGYGRSALAAMNLRSILLYDCGPLPESVKYAVGLSVIVAVFWVIVIFFWLLPLRNRKTTKPPPTDPPPPAAPIAPMTSTTPKIPVAPKASVSPVPPVATATPTTTTQEKKYFKEMKTRKDRVPHDFFKQLSSTIHCAVFNLRAVLTSSIVDRQLLPTPINGSIFCKPPRPLSCVPKVDLTVSLPQRISTSGGVSDIANQTPKADLYIPTPEEKDCTLVEHYDASL
uniref:Formin-like protein n=1 Tax=Steinernema glaseri TaxID=37863 RepID=A0A1I7YA99_9BILA